MQANALTVIPADIDVVEPGDEVQVLMLDWSRGEDCGSYLSESPGGFPARKADNGLTLRSKGSVCAESWRAVGRVNITAPSFALRK